MNFFNGKSLLFIKSDGIKEIIITNGAKNRAMLSLSSKSYDFSLGFLLLAPIRLSTIAV